MTDPLSRALAEGPVTPNENAVRTGVVVSANPFVVDIQGALAENVGCLTSYGPAIGDVVSMLRQDGKWLCLGSPRSPVVPSGSAGRGRVDYVAFVADVGPYTTETTILTSNVVTFAAGRAYSLRTRIGFSSGGAANYQHLLYRRGPGLGALFGQAVLPINTNVRVDTYHEHVVVNGTGADIVTSVVVTAQGAAAATALGHVQFPRSLGIYEEGAAVDFPNAIAI